MQNFTRKDLTEVKIFQNVCPCPKHPVCPWPHCNRRAINSMNDDDDDDDDDDSQPAHRQTENILNRSSLRLDGDRQRCCFAAKTGNSLAML